MRAGKIVRHASVCSRTRSMMKGTGNGEMRFPKNHGRRWTLEDDEELRVALDKREPVKDIAMRLGRRQDAVRGRAWALGLTIGAGLRRWRGARPRR
jgi:hypothetical protein